MLNQIVIIGRLVRNPEIKESEGGHKYTNITLAPSRASDSAVVAPIPCGLFAPVIIATLSFNP